MSEDFGAAKSRRVNASRLQDYVGQQVRLACKVIELKEDIVIVEASDGGQITVLRNPNSSIQDPYIEVIGKVLSATTMKMATCLNMGSNLDMKLVNDTIELIHDPRFLGRMFC